MKYTFFLIALIPNLLPFQENRISKSGMELQWSYIQDQIHFKIKAPSDGWLAIGFNPNEGITDSYLLMARVIDGRVEVVEHYTLSPGNYKSLEKLGGQSLVQNQKGWEKESSTEVEFSIPINAQTKYRYDLSPGKEYKLILAYSREDDFKHHSMMRTSTNIKL